MLMIVIRDRENLHHYITSIKNEKNKQTSYKTHCNYIEKEDKTKVKEILNSLEGNTKIVIKRSRVCRIVCQ
jgi:hypothetical protein